MVLPNGDRVFLPCPTGDQATLASVPENALPDSLSVAQTYGSAFNIQVEAGGKILSHVSADMTISFVIPSELRDRALSILFWDADGWKDVENARVKGNRFEAQVDNTGIFLLAASE